MKSTVYGIILAALAASLSLASCSKEIEADPGNGGTPAAEGVREFTLSFAASVKSAPGTGDDWRNPVFSAGDVIRVSNNTTFEDCVVTGSGSAAKIKTTLAGTLTAVYPSTAAVLSSGTTGHITGITVPAAQDGTFAKANICMAENIAVGATSITLENKTALFKVTPPSGVTEFTVTSLKAVEGGVARTGTAVPINSSEVVLENKVITVSNATLTDFYVSLLPGAKLSDLSFEYTVTGETYDGAMKGIPEKDIEAQATALGKTKDAFNNLTAGNAYDIGSSGWHEYVAIGGLKWATMNIGANSTTEYGYYFFWGGTVGYKRNDSKWVKADVTPESELTNGFAQANDPHYDNTNSEYTKYTGTSGGKTVLDLADDAAYANWGGPWRMPTGGTSGEFQALNTAAPGSWTTESSVNGWKFTETSTSKTLFFPAAGCGYDTELLSAGDNGNYWSSSLDTGSTVNAYNLYFGSGSVTPDRRSYRYNGRSVRPVSCEFSVKDPFGGSEEEI